MPAQDVDASQEKAGGAEPDTLHRPLHGLIMINTCRHMPHFKGLWRTVHVCTLVCVQAIFPASKARYARGKPYVLLEGQWHDAGFNEGRHET